MLWNLFMLTLNRLFAIALTLVARAHWRLDFDAICPRHNQLARWWAFTHHPHLEGSMYTLAIAEGLFATAPALRWLDQLGWNGDAYVRFEPHALRGAARTKWGSYRVSL